MTLGNPLEWCRLDSRTDLNAVSNPPDSSVIHRCPGSSQLAPNPILPVWIKFETIWASVRLAAGAAPGGATRTATRSVAIGPRVWEEWVSEWVWLEWHVSLLLEHCHVMVEESLRALHSGPRGQQRQWHRRPGSHRWRGRGRGHGTVFF